MDIDLQKLTMMIVPVTVTKGTRAIDLQNQQIVGVNYTLMYPNLPNRSISVQEGDRLMNKWKGEGYGYSQRKWFLWHELGDAG